MMNVHLDKSIPENMACAAVAFAILRYKGQASTRVYVENGQAIHARSYQMSPDTTFADLLKVDLEQASRETVKLAEGEGSDLIPVVRGGSNGQWEIRLPGDLISGEMDEQFKQHLEHATAIINSKPEGNVLNTPILTPDEYNQIVHEWNATDREHDVGKFGFEDFYDRAEEFPDAPAVTDGGVTLTYAELNRQTNQLAHYLQSIGIGPDVVVGIFMERSLDFVISKVALQKAGGAFLPLDPAHPKDRYEFQIQDSGVPHIITSTKYKKLLPKGDFNTIEIDTIKRTLEAQPDTRPEHGLKDGNISNLFYTSGSTGRPKGVMMRHSYSLKSVNGKQSRNLNPGDKVLLKSSTGFTLILHEIYWPLLMGGHIIIAPPGKEKDASWLVDTILKEKIVGLTFVPSMLSLLMENPNFSRCQTVRFVYVVGERLSPQVERVFFEKLPNARLYAFYGCTEAPALCLREITANDGYGDRSVIGKPGANRKAYILDEYKVPVPIGVTGEIHAAGSLSRGYIRKKDLTAERFIANPFSGIQGDLMYQTGDLARFLPDGNMEFIGRSDFQIQVRGVRIEPGEIEAVLRQHPAVKDAVVIGKQDDSQNTRLVAYCIAQSDTRPENRVLRNLMLCQLPEYMVPARVLWIKEFPLNTSGKIDRLNFPDVNSEEVIEETKDEWVRTNAQHYIKQIFQKVLGTSHMGLNQSFYDLGGDSLLAFRALEMINRRFQTNLAFPDFYNNPSINQLEAIVSKKGYKTEFQYMVKLCGDSPNRNFFFFIANPSIEAYLPQNVNTYLLRSFMYDPHFEFGADINALYPRYEREIFKVQNDGPYHFGGFSLGGILAYETACNLQLQGHKIENLYLIDPVPVGGPYSRKIHSNLSAIFNHLSKRERWNQFGFLSSLILNFLHLPVLYRHRERMYYDFCTEIIANHKLSTFNGNVVLITRKDYPDWGMENWIRAIRGNLDHIELETNDHIQVDRPAFQRIWTKYILAGI